MNTPDATYRLQLHAQFGFSEVKALVPYLHELGITHIYASPIFKARPGSRHGYDVCDHQILNPELGDQAAYNGMMTSLKEYGMGWVQDIVPNHMAVSGENRMLVDVLENGEASRFFEFFDIDWDHPFESIKGRMIAPFLGAFYGKTLENGEITIGFDENGFHVRYYELRFPLRIDSYDDILTLGLKQLRSKLGRENPDYIKLLGVLYNIKNLAPRSEGLERYDQISFIKRMLHELKKGSKAISAFIDANLKYINGDTGQDGPERFDRLDALLGKQYFRLSFWKVAGEEINYRRFFSINELISLRVEYDEVFQHTHKFILEEVHAGRFSGLRIDHIDGLYDPTAYLKKLREEAPNAYIVVEKILIGQEPLPGFWPIQGTTGYDTLSLCQNLFVDRDNEATFDSIYAEFIEKKRSLASIAQRTKSGILRRHMAGDVDNLTRLVNSVSSRDRHAFDITQSALRQAISELLVQFPVYRTYISNDAARPADLNYIRSAIRLARRRNPDLRFEFDFLERFLLLEFDDRMSEDDKRQWIQFAMRFQQVTGPLMAKGMEDTAFYIYNRLVCLNEVGCEPTQFGIRPENFHEIIEQRRKVWPLSMNATATHDTKRGEDTRMRLCALSELADEWSESLHKFSRANARKRPQHADELMPDKNDEYFLYQTLLGSWPETRDEHYTARIAAYLTKAVREAKLHSGWINPDEEYENAYTTFASKILGEDEKSNFNKVFTPLHHKTAQLGALYSLAQTVLKVSLPGVPDFYQGSELWDLSLVDPDNRQPVDFTLRRKMLSGLKKEFSSKPLDLCESLLSHYEDGRIKLFTIWRTLMCRKAHPELFLEGNYTPLLFEGRHSVHAFGFVRQIETMTAIVLVPRLAAGLLKTEGLSLGDVFKDTDAITENLPHGEYEDVITGESITVEDRLHLDSALQHFPVALFLFVA
ncbi:malto-oligosyltrehalose synthase [Desulfovibrio inopinatus]|uniref:malto-oligosyltrehalose synthase n=1 Tax=Desulfovibrio inopinatus TaxID=102109 RepID=UPI00042448D9|nr:malto-oligosyltrehalose synthase [Desulfovibrio inopinatus]